MINGGRCRPVRSPDWSTAAGVQDGVRRPPGDATRPGQKTSRARTSCGLGSALDGPSPAGLSGRLVVADAIEDDLQVNLRGRARLVLGTGQVDVRRTELLVTLMLVLPPDQLAGGTGVVEAVADKLKVRVDHHPEGQVTAVAAVVVKALSRYLKRDHGALVLDSLDGQHVLFQVTAATLDELLSQRQ